MISIATTETVLTSMILFVCGAFFAMAYHEDRRATYMMNAHVSDFLYLVAFACFSAAALMVVFGRAA